ncbi:unnamed protein product [Nesidiocoris tenuis]|uniref:Uncharacterized protein n=1 Tax=Nesidiocoris tenuis TaxID=355587 RepID=A0A6H5HR40_9HEMI|nr:unnamed protein product [Nesidiocoris tenuis]
MRQCSGSHWFGCHLVEQLEAHNQPLREELFQELSNRRRLNDVDGGSANQTEPAPDPQPDSKISDEIEEYLNGLASKQVEFEDPKLKRERQKLLDLLTSYKRLSDKLDKKCEEAERQGLNVPKKEILARRAEIRALLHPELYRNRREEEKNKLVEKFSTKRLFNESDKVCPPDLTPVHLAPDERQLEKERFCRLIASAPARFHNVLDTPAARFKRLTRPPSTPVRHLDVRESEKDRLARIFATSAAFVKDPNLRKSLLKKLKEKQPPESSLTPTNKRASERLQVTN